jgi:hypothetical protein
MNVVSASVLLLSAGALGLSALPEPDLSRRLATTGVAETKPPVRLDEAGQRRGEGGRWRRVRVVLASPYGPHTETVEDRPKRVEERVDMSVVSALPEQQKKPAIAAAASNQAAKITSVASHSDGSAERPERRRHAKAKSPSPKRIDARSELSRADKGSPSSYRVATMDERP